MHILLHETITVLYKYAMSAGTVHIPDYHFFVNDKHRKHLQGKRQTMLVESTHAVFLTSWAYVICP